jgi:hypothetical protein
MKVGCLARFALIIALVAGLVFWATSDDAGEPPWVKVQIVRVLLFARSLADFTVYDYASASSTVGDLVEGSDQVAVVKVTAVGPYFNGRRAGGGMQAPPDAIYGVDQLYQARVERWLKGGGPDSIYFGAGGGEIPADFPQTQAAIRAAQMNLGIPLPRVGERYLLFLGPPDQVPELGSLSWYPRAPRLPSGFLLSPDGTASVVPIGSKSNDEEVARIHPTGSERALIEKIQQAVASSKK